jgi:acyl transferase domain-containing protein/acyl carrier protein
MDAGYKEPIAIVGMACRFPNALDYRQYWDNLIQGVDCISEVPAQRWDWRDYWGDPHTEKNKTHSRWGGFIQDVDKFDAAFFGISPREAQHMDPQQRLMLELSWSCLEDAGYAPLDLSGRAIGVFIGTFNYDYKELQAKYALRVEGHSSTGTSNAIIPNRLSYFFDFHGPSIPIDTACSSSLVAIHQAVTAIQMGECEAALVGGVNILATPTASISFSKLRMLSPTGRCRSFDASCDGFVRGEGAGLVFLKPLTMALEDHDCIYGVIKGVAINHGGRARTLTAPTASAQARVISEAFARADVAPATVSYIEAHGTGTPKGDPIEVEGLKQAFGNDLKPQTPFCGLGSVKTNIGHLEAAAGIAGLIKVLLAMQHGILPNTQHFNQLNPRIDLEQSPFYIVDKNRQWTPLKDANGQTLPLRAGISSFGYGGANAHILVEQAPVRESLAAAKTSPPHQLLTLSANSIRSLSAMARHYVTSIEARPEDFSDICYSANTTRSQLTEHLAVIGESPQGVCESLQNFAAEGQADANVIRGGSRAVKRIAFVYTGQGAQYPGMSRELFDTQPVFRQALTNCDKILREYLDKPLLPLLFDSPQAVMDQTAYTQPTLFALEYALTELWKSWGIVPDVVFGHSVGAYVAACVAGVLSLEQSLQLIAKRGQLMQSLPAGGAMAAVSISEDVLHSVLSLDAFDLDIAAINGPESLVLTGQTEPLAAAAEILQAKNISVKPLAVSHAFHSRLMEPIQAEFLSIANELEFKQPKIKIVSDVSGAVAGREIISAQYWADHVRQTVQFQRGMQTIAEQGIEIFLEIGPAAKLINMARRFMPQGLWLASLNAQVAPSRQMLESLAGLYCAGIAIDFKTFYQPFSHNKVNLPLYVFDRQSYWIDKPSNVARAEPHAGEHPLLGCSITLAGSTIDYYESHLDPDNPKYLQDHRVMSHTVIPGAAYVELALAAAQPYKTKQTITELQQVVFHKPLIVRENTRVQTVLREVDEQGQRYFEVWSVSDDKVLTPCKHASGKIRFSSTSASTSVSDIPVLSAMDVIEPSDHYHQWSQLGLQYGEYFQSIKSVQKRGNSVLAEVCLPQSLSLSHSDILHPVLLDGVFQTLLPLLEKESFNDGVLPLPVRIGAMTVVGKLPNHFKVKAQRLPTDPSGDIYHCRFRIESLQGALLVYIEDMQFKRVILQSDGVTLHAKQDTFAHFFYSNQWHPRSRLPIDNNAGSDSTTLLVVYSKPNQHLAQAIDNAYSNQSVIHAVFGEKTQQLDRHRWEIQPVDESAFRTLVGVEKQIDSVYFLGGFYPNKNNEVTDLAMLERLQLEGVMNLFRLIKALIAERRGQTALRLKLLTYRSCAVTGDESINPWGASLHGLAKVFAQEFPRVKSICIDLDCIDLDCNELDYTGQYLPTVIEEPARSDGAVVAVRNGERHVQTLEPVQLAETRPESLPLRTKGVYLILGGASGIGLALSRYLAKHYQATLIWVGRSTLDSQKQELIDSLAESGGQVIYHRADGCDLDAMQSVVKATVEAFGSIHGVVHSAMALHDQSLGQMTEDRFRQGLAPKIQASWVLHQASKDQSLDFMLLFSSILSLLGSKGQANYVAGCAFKDAFGHFLKNNYGIPVQIINWGYWGNVGAVSSEDYQSRMAARGLQAIEQSQGIEAMVRVLASPLTQVISAKVDRGLLDSMDPDAIDRKPVSTLKPKTGAALSKIEAELNTADRETLLDDLLDYMRENVAAIMHVDRKQLDTPTRSFDQFLLSEVGLDSLTAMDLHNRIRTDLNVAVPAETLIGTTRTQQIVEVIYDQLLLRKITMTSSDDAVDDHEMETLVL